MIDYPGDPMGNDPNVIWEKKLLKWLKRYLVIEIKGALRKPQATGGVTYEIMFPTVPPGFNFPWQSPKELDPSVPVGKNTFVYISPANPIVITGLIDLNTGLLTKAPSGIWQALQAVPAALVTPATNGGQYNVPQAPTPGAVAGTPLSGDLDVTTLFWVQWNGSLVCF